MNKTCIIVEDEIPSADRLEKLITDQGDLKIVSKLYSVHESIEWFAQNPLPDLLFLDIQLSDGTSLDILAEITGFPKVIFTTAYDQYLMDAFKFNSVDYLLKPIKADDLDRAVQKFERLELSTDFNGLIDQIRTHMGGGYRSKFLLKVGQKFHSITKDEVAYFYSESGTSYLTDKNGKKFILDQSLDTLETELDPQEFFRINRKMIISFGSIGSIDTFFNNRLILNLHPNHKGEVLVSREKVRAFKFWLDA